MSANATRETDRQEFARALGRFSWALSGGAARRAPAAALDALSFADPAASEASAPPRGDRATRLAAYRCVVRTFLDDSAAAAQARLSAPAAVHHGGAARGAAANTPAGKTRATGALARLEPVERAALLLVAVEGFSYEDAAFVIGLEPRELAGALARAREAFAALLAAGAQGRPQLRVVE